MTINQTVFARAARQEPTERTPVWFMRQAGRILPEYRAIRKNWTLVEICRQPELCAEVTLQPVERLDVDAAILFSDIMLPLIGVGIDLQIVDEVGPVIREPVRTSADLQRLRPIQPATDLPYVMESIVLIKRQLGDRLPLIGFSGAPFTLAAYLIEGRPTRDFLQVKSMMFGAPEMWHELMRRLTDIVIEYLRGQVEAGVDTLQLFDSWVGCLAPRDYAEFVQPYTRRIFDALKPAGIPFIHFGTNTATLLPMMKDDGGSIIGIDWHVPLDEAWDIVGHERGVQGNLDPAVLFAPAGYIRGRVADVLDRAADRPGHIFNLGHGLHPKTPLENVQRAVEYVREISAERSVGNVGPKLTAGAA
ncbi:MAG: uroporphyrinogen decarboxylase [Gemmatimonadaceae bacterium]